MSSDASPIDRLLTLGDQDWLAEWHDYRQLGLGPEHVPELMRIAADPVWRTCHPESPATYAPFHAWRALVLRLFGAKLGRNCHIYSGAHIWAPWNLEIGNPITDRIR